MRKDFQVALICAVAALPAGLAVSAALEYFPGLKENSGLAFWASSLATLLLLIVAVVIALRAEAGAERMRSRGPESWVWRYALWLSVAIVIIIIGDFLALTFFKQLRYGTLALVSISALFAALAAIHQTSKRGHVVSPSVTPSKSEDNSENASTKKTESFKSVPERINQSESIGNIPSGPTFFRQEAGSVIERMVIEGVQTRGMDTGFDIRGTIKDSKISNYKGEASTQHSFHLDRMHIDRLHTAPPSKIGQIQPSRPAPIISNGDGTFTKSIDMNVDENTNLGVLIEIKGEDIIDFYVTKNGKRELLINRPSHSGGITKYYAHANDRFTLNIVYKNLENKTDVGLYQWVL